MVRLGRHVIRAPPVSAGYVRDPVILSGWARCTISPSPSSRSSSPTMKQAFAFDNVVNLVLPAVGMRDCFGRVRSNRVSQKNLSVSKTPFFFIFSD